MRGGRIELEKIGKETKDKPSRMGKHLYRLLPMEKPEPNFSKGNLKMRIDKDLRAPPNF